MAEPPGTAGDDLPPLAEPPRERLRFSSFSVIRAVLVVVVAIVVLQLVALADTTLWWLAIATALAGLYEPAAMWLRRFIPGWAAIAIVVLGVVVIIGLLGYRGFEEMSAQLTSLEQDAVRTAQELEASDQVGDVATEFGLTAKVQEFFSDLRSNMAGGDAAAAVQSAASSGGALFAIWMLSLLMLIFGSRILRSAFAQIDDPVVSYRVSTVVVQAYQDSSRYVWLMIFRGLVIGVAAGLFSAALGVETPTAFGVWFAAMSFIPGIGIVLGALPLALTQSITSAPLGVAIIGGCLLIQVVDVVFVQRRIEASTVHVGPGLMIVGTLVGLQLYGLGGILVVLAATIFTMAFVRRLTNDHDNAVSAARALLEPTPADI